MNTTMILTTVIVTTNTTPCVCEDKYAECEYDLKNGCDLIPTNCVLILAPALASSV